MPKPKNASSYSLTLEAKELLRQLSDTMGLPKNGVLETAIRRLARQELPDEKTSGKSKKSAKI